MSDTETAASSSTKAAPTFVDEMQSMSFTHLEGLIKERNSLVGTINAANGDKADLVNQLTEEATDKDIVAARKARDEAIAKLESLVKPKVEALLSNAAASVEEATEKAKEIEGVLKPGISYYKKMYGDEAGEFFTPLVRSRSARIGSSATGGRRIRGYSLSVTVDGKITDFENFASAAKFLDVETATLQDKFFEAAGNPAALKDAPDKVQFDVTFTSVDEDEKEYEVHASFLASRTVEEETEEEGGE